MLERNREPFLDHNRSHFFLTSQPSDRQFYDNTLLHVPRRVEVHTADFKQSVVKMLNCVLMYRNSSCS